MSHSDVFLETHTQLTNWTFVTRSGLLDAVNLSQGVNLFPDNTVKKQWLPKKIDNLEHSR